MTARKPTPDEIRDLTLDAARTLLDATHQTLAAPADPPPEAPAVGGGGRVPPAATWRRDVLAAFEALDDKGLDPLRRIEAAMVRLESAIIHYDAAEDVADVATTHAAMLLRRLERARSATAAMAATIHELHACTEWATWRECHDPLCLKSQALILAAEMERVMEQARGTGRARPTGPAPCPRCGPDRVTETPTEWGHVITCDSCYDGEAGDRVAHGRTREAARDEWAEMCREVLR